MRKEVITAILVGLILGLVITLSFYRTQLKPASTTTTTQVQQASQSASSEPTGIIVLTQPEDEIIVHSEKITVKGTALANKYYVVFVNNKEKIGITSENGSFEDEVSLSPGANIIAVHSFDAQDLPTSIERLVVWEEDLAGSLPKESPEAATNSAVTPPVKKASPTPTPTKKP